LEPTQTEYVFKPESCKFDTEIVLSFNPQTMELTFRMKWNNSGAKWYTEDQAFALQFAPTPNDIIVEGYRTKTIRVKRPVLSEDNYPMFV